MQRRNSLGARQYSSRNIGANDIYGSNSPPPLPPPPPPPPTHIGGSTPKSYSGSAASRRVKYSSDDSIGESPVPYSFSCSDDDYELPGSRRPRRSRSLSYRNAAAGGRAKKCRYWMVSCCIFMAIIFVAAYLLVPHYKRVVLDHHLIKQDKILREQEIDLSIRFDSKIAELQKENKELHSKVGNEKELIILNQQLKDEKNRLEFQMKDVSKELQQHYEGQIEILNRHNDHFTTYKKKMQENIQLMSRTALMERYGLGPHFVEMVVQFDSHMGRDDQGSIIVELAPVEDMPHAVYWFLEQVQRKLYDGCSFHRNAAHVIQAGPASNFLSPPDPQLSKRFKDAGFDKILFQEYSPNSPHVKFSLGYSGRPGGPDFYISMQDNSKIHGPGGQNNFEDPEEADTCFAKVVNGFDVVERIHKSPTKKGEYHAMESNIAIVSMTIMKKNDGKQH